MKRFIFGVAVGVLVYKLSKNKSVKSTITKQVDKVVNKIALSFATYLVHRMDKNGMSQDEYDRLISAGHLLLRLIK